MKGNGAWRAEGKVDYGIIHDGEEAQGEGKDSHTVERAGVVGRGPRQVIVAAYLRAEIRDHVF